MPEPRRPIPARALRLAASLWLLLGPLHAVANAGGVSAGESYKFVGGDPVEVLHPPVRVSVLNGQLAPNTGYAPLQVSVDNELGQATRLSLELSATDSARSVSTEVAVPAGARQTLSLPIPSDLRTGVFRAKRLDGPGEGQTHLWFYRGPGRALAVLGTPARFEQLVAHPPDSAGATFAVVTFQPEAFPDSLPALVGFDAVVVLEPGLSALGSAQQRALEAYAATGGELVIAQPTPADLALLPLLHGQAPLEPYGFGEVIGCPAGGCQDVLAAAGRHLPAIQPAAVGQMGRATGSSGTVYPGPSSPPELMLSQGRPPVGQFLFLLAIFTLLVGPGSLWVARRRGPTWVLLSIPGTALLTSLLIIGWSLVSEGLASYGRVGLVTLLDRKRERVVTAEVAALYANLSPRAPRLDAATAPIGPWTGGHTDASFEWSGGLHFASDFLPSRTYREWGFLTVQPARARLRVERVGTGVRVQNALGGRITSALLRLDGKSYQLAELPDGAQALATPTEGRMNQVLDPDLEARFPEHTRTVLAQPLSDGQFVAKVTGSERLPLGLSLRDPTITELIRGEVE